MMTERSHPIALLLVCTALSCSHEASIRKPITPVRVQAVADHSGGGGVRYSATIEPHTQVSLSFKTAGYIDEILQQRGADGRQRAVQAGDPVRRGAVLARVRSSDYVEQVNQARAAEAEAHAARDKARLDLDRANALFESHSLTRADLDAAKAAFESYDAKVRAAAAQLRQAENLLADSALKAPMDGVLLERRIEIGSLVGAGSVGFTMADLTSVKAVFGVPDAMVESLKPGAPLTLTIYSLLGMEFTGAVTSVSPSADEKSRVFYVEVTIPNPGNALKAGMIATVRVGGPAAASVPVVPLSAIVRPPGGTAGYAVFAIEGEGDALTARSRLVTLGEVFGNQIGITSGLKSGERVIVSGATIVVDGEPVRIVP